MRDLISNVARNLSFVCGLFKLKDEQFCQGGKQKEK